MTKRRTRRRHDSAAVAAGTTKPSSQKAICVSTWSTIHPKFMPKNPVTNVSGTKIGDGVPIGVDVRRTTNRSLGDPERVHQLFAARLNERCRQLPKWWTFRLGSGLTEDGRCPARTGDLLLVSASSCCGLLPPVARTARRAMKRHIAAALCCGLSLPRRFHMSAPAFTRREERGAVLAWRHRGWQ